MLLSNGGLDNDNAVKAANFDWKTMALYLTPASGSSTLPAGLSTAIVDKCPTGSCCAFVQAKTALTSGNIKGYDTTQKCTTSSAANLKADIASTTNEYSCVGYEQLQYKNKLALSVAGDAATKVRIARCTAWVAAHSKPITATWTDAQNKAGMYAAEATCDNRWTKSGGYTERVNGGFMYGLQAATGGSASGNTGSYLNDAQMWFFMWTFAKEVDYTEEHCNNAKTVATPDPLDKAYSAFACLNNMG